MAKLTLDPNSNKYVASANSINMLKCRLDKLFKEESGYYIRL